ncbi:MAG: alpha/beta fold hydrolase [Pseudomonadota bacterium]|nr:alpha/beta fold hydrolase [Pseudomonadota bacterium]
MAPTQRTFFVDTPGARLEVFEAVAQGTTPERLALCLHGFPEHAHAWRHQMAPLAALGYRIWAPNLRGYGNSSRPTRMRDYALEHLLDDVAGLIDASGCRECVLIAHDWGAIVAWYFAMRRVRPLSRLVIMNVPHPEPMAREFRVNPRQRASSWYTVFFQIPVLPEWLLGRRDAERIGEIFRTGTVRAGAINDADAEIFASSARQPGALKAMVDYYRAMGRGGGARRQQRLGHPEIDVPTLLLWGEQDVALRKASTYGTERWVSPLTVRYLPHCSHRVQQDDPDLVNEMLTAFLGDEPVPHAARARGDLEKR